MAEHESRPRRQRIARVLGVLVLTGTIALLLHFVWEMGQMSFFMEMRDLSLVESAKRCFQAALGDVLITTLAYLGATTAGRSIRWPIRRSRIAVLIWFAAGLIITVAFERYALATGRWTYAREMPTIGGVSVLPLVQWIVIPTVLLIGIRATLRATPIETR